MYICQKYYSIDILPQAKEERERHREGERGDPAGWVAVAVMHSISKMEGGGLEGGWMSLSSVSSALSLNERWVLLHRQPRGPRKGSPRLLLIPSLLLLRSPILQGADSSKIRKPASPPPAQPHFPIITTTTKVGGFLFTNTVPVFTTCTSSVHHSSSKWPTLLFVTY